MNPIIPTVGRVVYFTPSMNLSVIPDANSGVCAALITAVHNDNCVNLAVFDANGYSHSRCSVCHVSTLPEVPEGSVQKYDCWDWMPYQKGQAAKTEQLEAKLGDAHQKPSLAYCQQTGSLCNAEDLAIEQQIQAKGLNAPRLTPSDIDAKILGADYKRFNGSTLTVCCLYLENGFTVTGESACASLENFDEEIGKKIAYQNAREKVWQLEGYLLRQRLHDEEFSETTPQQRVLLEKHELDEKIEKLSAFLSKPKPDFVSEAQWGLMSFQIYHMKKYREVLRGRLVDFGVIAEPLSPHSTINS